LREIGAVDVAVLQDLGDPEVEHLHEVVLVAARLEVDVRGLQVAVNDAERVRLRERAAHGARDRDHLLPRHRAARAIALVQALATQELHHDVERPVVGLTELVRRDRVRIAEQRQRRALAPKPRDHARVRGQVRVEHLEREVVTRLEVGRAIDRPEPARGDLRFDTKPPIEHLAQERIETLNDRVLDVVLFRSHAHGPLWQGFQPSTSHVRLEVPDSDRVADAATLMQRLGSWPMLDEPCSPK
jgi:hypothetical protein